MTEPTPFYMSKGFVASGALLAVILFVGAGMALTSGGAQTSSVGVRHARAAGTTRAVNTGGSRCGLPVGNTDKPVGPPLARWKLSGLIVVPSSPAMGPGIETGRLRACYAHSPTGALFSAAGFLAMASDPNRTARELRQVLAETHARNVLLRQNAEPSDPFARVSIAGFRVNAASPDFVTVDLALQTNVHGAIVAMHFPMRWENRPGEGGDWRFMITNADQPYTGAQLDDLAGFVLWSQT